MQPSEPHPARPLHALLVEDNLINQQVALGQLAALGIHAEVASDGLAALRALELSRYDVILMDCQLPEIDGYEITRRLRRQEGLNRRTPVVAVTASAIEGELERCLAAGMDHYLAKPLRLEILAGLLRRLFVDGVDGVDGVSGLPA